jgi:hypothetical protein
MFESLLAATLLSHCPTAWFRGAWVKKLARIVYDGSHEIGEELASALIETPAKVRGELPLRALTNCGSNTFVRILEPFVPRLSFQVARE